MKTAIVTGASGNLGQAVIERLLADDYFVTGTVRSNTNMITEIRGKHFETAVVDLTQEEAARQFVELVAVKRSRIDVAVLTVGGYAAGTIAQTKTSDISRQLQLNFDTAYNVARPVFQQMKKQGGGRIFLIGSRPGNDMKQSKGMVAYGFAKSLIFRLAELMNEEAKGTNVVVSVVVPSTIDTPENRKSMPSADFSKWVAPAAIADIIAFHCSDAGNPLRESVIKIYGNA